jgi:putative phosphoribosyl transferase
MRLVFLRRLLSHSRNPTVFENRRDAALKLAARLVCYKGKNALVLGIPRGAVPMARVIAEELGGEVDVALVRKLCAPGNPELAVGSVDESGWTHVAGFAASAGADAPYVEQEKQRQLEVIRQRRALYTDGRDGIDPAGRLVIVVDDGLATGSTMIAALHALRQRQPSRLICAVPVAPPETAAEVAKSCDELVCLETPDYFYAVGQFYRHFSQVEDYEVAAALRGGPGPGDGGGRG